MTGIKYNFNFLAMVHTDDRLYCNNYNLNLYLTLNIDSEYDQDVAFRRMDLFIYEIIANSVFVPEDNPDLLERYMALGIPTIAIQKPGPIDHMILMTLVTKLNAICEESIIIHNGELSSVLGQGVEYIFFDDGEDTILSGMETKWWNNITPSFVSTDCITPSTTEKIHELTQKITWKDYELYWEYEAVEIQSEESSPVPDNIVLITDFDK